VTSLSLLNSRRVHLLTGFLLAALWGSFAYRHVIAWEETREWVYLLFCLSETLTAAFFVLRRPAATLSAHPMDWGIAIAGTIAPLFFTPASFGIFPAAKSAIVAGIVLQIFGMCSLNRSFALVAAKRAIKTRGMYRFIRHPLYASYLIMFGGYLMANTTTPNSVVYLLTMACLFARILREEKHLALDSGYRQYMLEVRYRVFPGIF
jgi:protein-S-isoprenylcysteine O-methyltransferase Ste14